MMKAFLVSVAVVTLLSTFLVSAPPSSAAKITSGEDVIRAMHDKYAGKWYSTLTFSQKTTNYDANGKADVSQWYEALNAPGKLRIDFAPLDKRDGVLFADGKLYSWRDGKANPGRPFLHPLLVLGFDVYVQPVETTIAQVKGPDIGIDTSVVHEDKWQGEDVYVVGAKAGDLKTPQFWVTKKNLLFVRLIQLAGRDKKMVQETQFNKYVKAPVGGGWVSAEVKFFVDGKPATTEEYSDIKTGLKLDNALWDADKWMTVDRAYINSK